MERVTACGKMKMVVTITAMMAVRNYVSDGGYGAAFDTWIHVQNSRAPRRRYAF